MRIAVFHNFMDNIGGAEMVSLILGRELGADIYTTNIDAGKVAKMGFPKVSITSIGSVPKSAPFRQQKALSLFRKLNMRDEYDFYVIAGDWAMSGAVKNSPNMWYVHSPIREIWDLYEYTRSNMVPWHLRPAFDAWVRYNRWLNKRYVSHVGRLACNSENTKTRVLRYLGREASVIHPPVDTGKFHYRKSGDFWLSVNRLISHKRIEIQMGAFRKMPDEKLIIVGSYEKTKHFMEYERYLRSIKPDNVQIVNWVDSEKLIKLYSECRGLIATAGDEDFGLTPVEAMASGKPVIAANEGGYRETVLDGVTGRLIDRIDAPKLASAVDDVGNVARKYKGDCIKRAKQFDTKVFIGKMKEAMG
jgi:glycosyltransferase involved in cell wall biosynthesis